MTDLENHCLHVLKTIYDCSIIFFFRYVDDILLCVDKKHIEDVIHVFNSYHNKFKFTYEIENDASIPFLDVKLIRRNNSIITNWFTKPTSSGRLINFDSNHPIKQKRATIHHIRSNR